MLNNIFFCKPQIWSTSYDDQKLRGIKQNIVNSCNKFRSYIPQSLVQFYTMRSCGHNVFFCVGQGNGQLKVFNENRC